VKRSIKKTIFSVSCLGLVGLSGLIAGCTGDAGTTDYVDYLNASGTVYQADGTTAASALPINDYTWNVTYTDGSSVAVPFTPGVSTDATGKFGFDSSQLALVSGNQAESCESVCTDTAVGYEDVCTDWEVDSEQYCADWEPSSCGSSGSPGSSSSGSTGSSGGGCGTYCADWETQDTTYCAASVTEEYTYCDEYGQDCGFFYPARDIKDIVSANSEITFTAGPATVTTQSEATTFAKDLGVVSNNPQTQGNTTIANATWFQADKFVTSLTAGGVSTTAAKAYKVLTAQQIQLTAAQNAGNAKKHAVLKYGFGRNHAPARKLPFEGLSAAGQAKVQSARTAFGASALAPAAK
jgi:hypothetical protein